MSRVLLRAAWVLLLWALLGVPVFAAPFVPEQPVVPLDNLRPGMRGHMLTVLKGTKPTRLPVEIVDMVPQRGAVKNHILLRLLPSSENGKPRLSQGMSGSPFYVGGRLAGAISAGWDFSDHTLALATPIEEMCDVFSYPDKPVGLGLTRSVKSRPALSLPLSTGGLSRRAVAGLEARLRVPVEVKPYGASGELPLSSARFSPGETISVLLVWGDVEMTSAGTVTATSKDGRFLAFGHSFLGRGAVNFPVARAQVHETVVSRAFPHKIASPVSLAGTATQDRTAGVGGRMGYFTPSIAASFVFRDSDVPGPSVVRKFRVVPDAYLGAGLLEGIYEGLFDDQWNRTGQGTVTVTLRVEARGLEQGWTRTNVFFSDSDLSGSALKESSTIIAGVLTQAYQEVFPIGFNLDVTVTQEPKVLYIEDVAVSQDARPGDVLSVQVSLRPWRRKPIQRRLQVIVPKEATGICELVVRGGGTNPFGQLAVEGGWKAINGFDRMLTEFGAADANNELIVELFHDQVDSKSRKDSKKSVAELLPEEKEFLSETKARRIKEGTLRVLRSEYVVEGMMKRLINLGEDAGKDGAEK